MAKWFIFLGGNESCHNTPCGSNSDNRKSRLQRMLRVLIRWTVNGTGLAIVHNHLFQASWTTAICIGIVVSFFSAMLQYQTPLLTKFYECDTLANTWKERESRTNERKTEFLRWSERAFRWFFIEMIYVLYSEYIRALFGINIISSLSLIAYVIQRLCGAITSTASQGAWELVILAWRKKRIESQPCLEVKANSQRDWAFLFGSLISVSSLAASLSPYPKLGYCGFGVLVVGAIILFRQMLKTTLRQQN